MDAIDQIRIDRVPGEEIRTVSLPGLPPIGTPICYENSFPSIDREMVRAGRRLPGPHDQQRVLRADRRLASSTC